MDNPTINEEIQPTPQVISEEIKPKKSFVKPLLIILISLVLLLIGTIAYLYFKNGPDFLNTLLNKELVEEEYVETESEKEANALLPGEVMITGELTFPGETIPSLKVCAVNIEDEKETCVQTPEGANNYTLTVKSGTYLIYAADGNSKAYYTECDTYTNPQEDPRCNSNYNDSQGAWNDTNFICYQDPTCKAAFTPLQVTVGDTQSITLQPIVQGWYIPCSHPADVCNDPAFDVWSDYLK